MGSRRNGKKVVRQFKYKMNLVFVVLAAVLCGGLGAMWRWQNDRLMLVVVFVICLALLGLLHRFVKESRQVAHRQFDECGS